MTRSIYTVDLGGHAGEIPVVASTPEIALREVCDDWAVPMADAKVTKTVALPSLANIDGDASRCGTCYRIAEANGENEGYSSCCNDRIEYPGEYNADVQFLLAVATGEVTQ